MLRPPQLESSGFRTSVDRISLVACCESNSLDPDLLDSSDEHFPVKAASLESSNICFVVVPISLDPSHPRLGEAKVTCARWYADDADVIAPTLYTRKRRKRTDTTAEATDKASGEATIVAPPAPVPPPTLVPPQGNRIL